MFSFFTKNEYQKIANLFNLGQIQKLKKFQSGYQTPKVAVTTPKGDFVIAKHNISNKHEINFLAHLKRLPVPRHVLSRHHQYLEDFHGFAVGVYYFLSGRHPKKITPKMAYQLGLFVGSFHKLGEQYKLTMSGRRKFYDLNPKAMTLMYRYAKQQTNLELDKVVEKVRQGVEKNRLPKYLPRGPVHVDIKPDNELFIGEKLTG